MSKNRALLKWKVPRTEFELMKKQFAWKDWATDFGKVLAKFALGGFLIGLIIFIIAVFSVGFEKNDFLVTILFFTAFGAFFGFISSLITIKNLLDPPEITMCEKGITALSFDGDIFQIAYRDIQNCSIEKRYSEEKDVYFLVIKDWGGIESFIEIAPNIKSDDIIEILKMKNIEVKSSLFNPA